MLLARLRASNNTSIASGSRRRRGAPWRLCAVEKFKVGGRDEALCSGVIGDLDPPRTIIFF